MLKTIKAKFTDGVLVPLEPVEFKEGEEILLSFDDGPKMGAANKSGEHTRAVLRETAGAWQGSHDPEELIRRIYAERLSGSSPTPEI